MKAYVRELRGKLEDLFSEIPVEAWSLEPTRNGHLCLLVTASDSHRIRRYTAGSPSDCRSVANFIAGVRRALTRGGKHG